MSKYKYIKLNAAQCPNCLDILVSLYRHDFKQCRCKMNFVDGGFDYDRRTVGSLPLDWYVKRSSINEKTKKS